METKTLSTKDVIVLQLLENTGRDICDSGDYYGRGFQRDAGKSFEDLAKDPVRLEASVYQHGDKPELELLGYISTAAWLDAQLEYLPELQQAYEDFASGQDEYDLALMEGFAEKFGRPRWGGDINCVNTYNGECDLNRTLQFVEFEWEDSDGNEIAVALLQTHNGCDVRSGYSSPKAYALKGDSLYNWNIDGLP